MKKDKLVYILQDKKAKYPNDKDSFNPSTLYPEYQWGKKEISKTKNHIYEMVRKTLYGLEMDKDNFNTPNWNPFKEIIKPGMNVVIKPNMVLSHDPRKKDPLLKSLVTNPSIIRAVIDYIYIALKTSGSITIADAPLQSCDFTVLRKKVGYNTIIKFYKNKNIKIKIIDIRQYASKYISDGILEPIKSTSDPLGYTLVHLKDKSAHKNNKNISKKFRVTNYDHRKMRKYHNKNDDSYIISNTILNADLIISIPKLKTHRKAGMTCALKNFIGIIGHKDCLPHHSTGSKSEGGDEYLYKNIFKYFSVKFTEILNIAMINMYSFSFPILKKIINKLNYFAEKNKKDDFHEGSWYGNDTIWRTILDIVRIALYSDKKGNIKHTKQRNIFTIVDGVISGEKEGPLEPTSKHSGVLIGGYNPANIDFATSSIMGFDYNKIPTIKNSFQLKDIPISNEKIKNKIKIKSNNPKWNNKHPTKIAYKDSLKFIPSSGWIHHIEKI